MTQKRNLPPVIYIGGYYLIKAVDVVNKYIKYFQFPHSDCLIKIIYLPH